MISVICYKCKEELKEPGALLFSPPSKDEGLVNKFHICMPCWNKLFKEECNRAH